MSYAAPLSRLARPFAQLACAGAGYAPATRAFLRIAVILSISVRVPRRSALVRGEQRQVAASCELGHPCSRRTASKGFSYRFERAISAFLPLGETSKSTLPQMFAP